MMVTTWEIRMPSVGYDLTEGFFLNSLTISFYFKCPSALNLPFLSSEYILNFFASNVIVLGVMTVSEEAQPIFIGYLLLLIKMREAKKYIKQKKSQITFPDNRITLEPTCFNSSIVWLTGKYIFTPEGLPKSPQTGIVKRKNTQEKYIIYDEEHRIQYANLKVPKKKFSEQICIRGPRQLKSNRKKIKSHEALQRQLQNANLRLKEQEQDKDYTKFINIRILKAVKKEPSEKQERKNSFLKLKKGLTFSPRLKYFSQPKIMPKENEENKLRQMITHQKKFYTVENYKLENCGPWRNNSPTHIFPLI